MAPVSYEQNPLPFCAIELILIGLVLVLSAQAENIVFPDDVMINVKRAPYNAKGDGFVNEVMETRGTETRSLPRGKGWFSWTLFSAQSDSGSDPKGAAARRP